MLPIVLNQCQTLAACGAISHARNRQSRTVRYIVPIDLSIPGRMWSINSMISASNLLVVLFIAM